MKKLIYSIVFFSMLFSINSCDCKEISSDAQNEIDFLIKIISDQQSTLTSKETLNYCKSTEAVERGSYYNTIDGTAKLNFRIPKGHRLELDPKKSKPSKNILYYVCVGEKYSDNTENKTIEIDGLKSGEKAEKSKLHVYLIHKFKINKCTNYGALEEKHKGTVVTGEPLQR